MYVTLIGMSYAIDKIILFFHFDYMKQGQILIFAFTFVINACL